MISSAHICFDTQHFAPDLTQVAELLREKTSWLVSTTQWSGYGITIPQLLIHTPIPFLIQMESDPEWVPEDIQELLKRDSLDPEVTQKLKHCDARLAIQSTAPDQVINDGHSITVSILGMAIDPQDPDILKVLRTLARELEGVIDDCVNGGIIV